MLFSASFVVAALVGIAQAQTPQGFTPAVNTKLEVMFNSTAVKTPGERLAKAATESQPQLAITGANTNQQETFMFVMLDLDVPPQGGNSTRRVLLHALNTGFKATSQKVSNGTLLASSQKGPAAYIAPSPPASDTVPHRYVELLFQQPSSFSVQATEFENTQARINFDINAFIQKNSLSAPLAANFFTVDGRAGGGASGTATSTGGISRNTLQPFTGAAGRTEFSLGFAGLLGGLALIAA